MKKIKENTKHCQSNDSNYIGVAETARKYYQSYIKSLDEKELRLAKKEINKALLLFNNGTKPKDFIIENKKNLFGLAGEIYAHFDKEKSLEYFKISQFYLFNKWIEDISKDENKDKKYFNDKRDEGVTAYKFRDCSPYLFADLTNNEITLSRPQCMNDPFDSLYSIWSEEDNLESVLKDKIHIPMFKKSFDYYRFCSFCIDNDAENTILKNILMWSHYANEHKGICIKYKLQGNCINTDCSDDVHPQALLHRIDYQNKKPISVKNESIKIGLAFAHKDSCWEYEKEARLIHYDTTKEDDHITIPYDKDISIEAVYFGIRCSDNNKAIIKNLLDNKDVIYYDMKYNYENVYRMKIDDNK